MPWVTLSFDPALAVLLPPECRDGPFRRRFRGRVTVKHLVESLGVPHTEVGRVQINGREAPLDAMLRSGDHLEVFPPLPPAAREPPVLPRFVLDNHLGRLAALLRLLGFDALYRNDFQDEELAEIASSDERILLTRDHRLLMRKTVERGYWVRSLEPEEQVREVVRRFQLAGCIQPFRRCPRCNTLLEPVEKEAILDRLQPLTRQYYDEFHRCPGCGQIYWKGSHYERIRAWLDRVLQEGS